MPGQPLGYHFSISFLIFSLGYHFSISFLNIISQDSSTETSHFTSAVYLLVNMPTLGMPYDHFIVYINVQLGD